MSRLDEYIVTCHDMQKAALLTFAGCTANIGLRYIRFFRLCWFFLDIASGPKSHPCPGLSCI